MNLDFASFLIGAAVATTLFWGLLLILAKAYGDGYETAKKEEKDRKGIK